MGGPVQSCTARAPGSVGNVAVGFDILGHAFDAVFDTVVATRTDVPGIQVTCSGPGAQGIPLQPSANTAGRAAQAVLSRVGVAWGLTLHILKGIPVASGLGGSGASAVAGAVAANGLLEQSLATEHLLDCALEGEAAATGARVIDNVAASLVGGLVFALDGNPPIARSVYTPRCLHCAVVLPDLVISTQDSRAGLPDHLDRATAVAQMANLAGVLVGCQQRDLDLVGRFLRDAMIEPQRAAQVPGFERVQEAAMAMGALGCSLSGSGPAVFAWCDGKRRAQGVARAMAEAFDRLGIGNRRWLSPVNAAGAQIMEQQ